MVAQFRPERAAGTWGESAQRGQLHIGLPGRDEAGQGGVRGGHATRGAARAARRGEGEVREGGGRHWRVAGGTESTWRRRTAMLSSSNRTDLIINKGMLQLSCRKQRSQLVGSGAEE